MASLYRFVKYILNHTLVDEGRLIECCKIFTRATGLSMSVFFGHAKKKQSIRNLKTLRLSLLLKIKYFPDKDLLGAIVI